MSNGIKDVTYEIEDKYLSPYAFKSRDTAGRVIPVEECKIRTEFQRDRDRIIHCKAFRRLKHKTQVFLSPEGDHYRTRLTHTLEVSQIARTVGRAIRLNEDLIEAIAMGHDLGHTPFGHAGERTLNELTNGRFSHNEQSVRVCEVLEKLIRKRWKGKSWDTPTASPTSITISTTAYAPGLSRKKACPKNV